MVTVFFRSEKDNETKNVQKMAAYNTGRMPRLSLEHLIRSSRDVSSAEGGDNDIIIDRSMYASRKNGRLATITSSFDTAKETRAGDTMRDMTIEAKYWRNLYMTLKQENNEDVQDADNLLQLTLDREAQLLSKSCRVHVYVVLC